MSKKFKFPTTIKIFFIFFPLQTAFRGRNVRFIPVFETYLRRGSLTLRGNHQHLPNLTSHNLSKAKVKIQQKAPKEAMSRNRQYPRVFRTYLGRVLIYNRVFFYFKQVPMLMLRSSLYVKSRIVIFCDFSQQGGGTLPQTSYKPSRNL